MTAAAAGDQRHPGAAISDDLVENVDPTNFRNWHGVPHKILSAAGESAVRQMAAIIAADVVGIPGCDGVTLSAFYCYGRLAVLMQAPDSSSARVG
jgi:hypothetical protein